MVPIQTDLRGGGSPARRYVDRKGQLVTLDLFDPRINNYNFVVAAESGAGKSFLLNDLCRQYYAQNALIRIIDIGGSYRKLCRSEEHTSELQSLMRISYAVFCLKKKKTTKVQIMRHNNISS